MLVALQDSLARLAYKQMHHSAKLSFFLRSWYCGYNLVEHLLVEAQLYL
jgi:hypothetical protein